MVLVLTVEWVVVSISVSLVKQVRHLFRFSSIPSSGLAPFYSRSVSNSSHIREGISPCMLFTIGFICEEDEADSKLEGRADVQPKHWCVASDEHCAKGCLP